MIILYCKCTNTQYAALKMHYNHAKRSKRAKTYDFYARLGVVMKEEQIDRLLKIIEKNGFATVKYIARTVYASESTVRRQLTTLERMGLIVRSYGGAELKKDSTNTPIEMRLQKNHKQKDIIAKRAAELITENSTVFIDASSTCLHMAPYLADKKHITVYTYSARLCDILAEYGLKDVYCLGGLYKATSKVFIGEYAVDMAQKVFYDYFFFSSSGFSDGTVFDYSKDETHIRRAILPNAEIKYFLCDSGKFGKRSANILCKKTELTGIITEKDE